MAVYVNLNRDSSKDIQLGNPSTVYTDSTTLTTGMKLYDNTGTDTGLTIGTVNQNSSFDIVTTMRYCFSFYGGYIFANTDTLTESTLVYDSITDTEPSTFDAWSSATRVPSLDYDPSVCQYWVLNGSPEQGSYGMAIDIYDEEHGINITTGHEGHGLIVIASGALTSASSFSLLVHPNINSLILHQPDWFNSTPIESYSNCTVIQDSQNPKITVIDKLQPVNITYFNDC